jgi:hypothetical protein
MVLLLGLWVEEDVVASAIGEDDVGDVGVPDEVAVAAAALAAARVLRFSRRANCCSIVAFFTDSLS